ncbi:MAG: squalene--hopene cyclase [Verrucomicrobiae bacterium]|nr:squalene--hopene cyclase [Verrucomicrobiae bacterium]NNJ42408.1 terpene cyclase/mutase family protein [Akkermansiaceae bacterium]
MNPVLHHVLAALTITSAIMPATTQAQSLPRRQNDTIPAQVESIYTRGLRYLSNTQDAEGGWGGGSGGRPGVVGLCTLAFLAHGADPNHGPYAPQIKKSISLILKKQAEGEDGYMGPQMYDHGFATLALAECYGMVDDPRIAPALKKAVDLILKAQKNNPRHGWRYSPTTRSSDTTVSGCQIVALLAARNAGIPVPDTAIQKGLAYMKSCRSSSGSYGYTSKGSGRLTLTAIGSLCYSLAKKKDEAGYAKSTDFLKKNIRNQDGTYPFYFRYYMSQALFQANEELWQAWNKDNIRLLSAVQLPDGSFAGNHGNAYSTAGALLSLALNYRFLPIYEK